MVIIRTGSAGDIDESADLHYEITRVAYPGLFPSGVEAPSRDDLLAEWRVVLADAHEGADAYAALLSGSGKGRARRPELVVLVSHEVATRGWTDVREGEVCKIPGVGPVSPQVARKIAGDAFLSGVFYDGVDLRNFARWSKHIPIEVAVALELGEPPGFDGVKCIDCGHRFRTEFDHVHPRVAGGPASNGNLKPRCWRDVIRPRPSATGAPASSRRRSRDPVRSGCLF